MLQLELQNGESARPDAADGGNTQRATVVSKSEYAKMRGRTASAVSHWIRSGKLSGPALIGRGRMAKVVVEEADQQLATLLDIAQQEAQESPIDLQRDAVDEPPENVIGQRGGAQADYYSARARKQQAEAEIAEAKLKVQQGVYLMREEAEAAWSRTLAELVRLLDEIPGRPGEPVAAELGCDVRALTLALRRETKRVRAEWSRHFERPTDADAHAEDQAA